MLITPEWGVGPACADHALIFDSSLSSPREIEALEGVCSVRELELEDLPLVRGLLGMAEEFSSLTVIGLVPWITTAVTVPVCPSMQTSKDKHLRNMCVIRS
jgi:hypothetical protein